ncbi:SDR family NAD(P)-dependent oxidoreductase [Luteimonas pelagia]
MRVLITGGAGFIGSHLVDLHIARGDHVHVLDDLSTGNRANLAAHQTNPFLQFDEGDLNTWDGLDDAVAAADRVYNMAAVVGMFRVLEQPVEVTKVNTMGCERLLQCIADAGHKPQTVLISSSSVYGPAKYEDLHEEADIVASPDAPLLNYAISKLSNEIQGRAYAAKYGMPVTIARLFNTVGLRQSGQYGFVVPRFVQQALAGEPITVFGDGSQTRSFCDVRDTAAMLDTLARTPAANAKVVNVGNIQEITILELAELVKARVGSDSPIRYVPYAQAYGQSFAQIPQRRPILDRLQALTGYRHRFPLVQTIDDLCAHYRMQLSNRRPDGDAADVEPLLASA